MNLFRSAPRIAPVGLPIADPTAGELAYSTLRDGMQVLFGASEAIDSKLGTFAATGSGLVGILLAVLALRSTEVSVATPWLWLAIAAYVALIAAAGYGLLPAWWEIGPSPSEILDDAQRGCLASAIRENAAVALDATYRANKRKLASRGVALRVSFFALVCEVAFLAVALGAVALGTHLW